ncbi:uncharacterized protein LOC144643005 [Oculina patagonica]
MDVNKRTFIDRFVQSVAYHGPSLITLTKDEQGDGEGSATDFLHPSTEGHLAMNYFTNRLQASCSTEEASQFLGAMSGIHQTSEKEREIVSSHNQQGIKRSSEQDNDFHQKVRKFIASKADLLFSMEGKKKLRRGIDYGMHSNQEVLDLYADTPPLETLMEVPLHVRRKQLFKCLKEGDIVVGRVAFKRPYCIIVTLTMLEFGCNRDFTDLDIQALCKLSELDSSEISKEYKDPADTYVVGDVIRGVIVGVNLQENRVSISLKQSRLPEEHKHLHLGIIEDPDTVFKRLQSNPEGLSFEEHLSKHKGFNNPRNIDTLTDLLGVDTSAPCSLLRSFQRYECPEGEYADVLRKQQSAKWSMETTARGVEHFKAGNYDPAMKYFKHALQIDGENVEALVARGALCANQDQLSIAIKDFHDALAICPSHRNAKKYLTATLVEHGIQQEKESLLTEAVQSFKEALGLDNNQQTAKEHLDKLQQQLKLNEQRKAQAATKVDKGLKSRFSHVRELILEEQSQAKKKQKKKNRKKKKKVKNLKKKKKKPTSKSRRRSRRSSSSSRSSSESSSESDSSVRSTDSEEWVESTATGQNETKKQGSNSKPDHENNSGRESPVRAGLLQKETKLHRSRKKSKSSEENDEKKTENCSPTRGRAKDNCVKRKMKRFSSSRSSSSRSPSVERERERERVGRKKSRERVGHDIHLSPKKRKTSECELYRREGDDVSKRKQSSPKGSCAVSSFHEKSLEGMLKRIRENSGKDVEFRQKQAKQSETSADYCASKTDVSLGGRINTTSDNRSNLERIRSHETEQKGARHFKESFIFKNKNSAAAFVSNSKAGRSEAGRERETSKSLGLWDQRSRSTTDRKPSLVSYEASSDEDK